MDKHLKTEAAVLQTTVIVFVEEKVSTDFFSHTLW